jgi:hypothetical protein
MFRRVENLRMWARNTFHGWVLRSPHGFERRKRWGGATVRKGTETLAPGRGGYIAQRPLSVVPTGCRYYRRSPEKVTERSYRYTDTGPVLPGGPVVPTPGRFYRGSPEIKTENSYRYYRPCVGCTGNLSSFWKDLRSRLRFLVRRNMDM